VIKDQDVRIKVTEQTHAILRRLASLQDATIQDYVEGLITKHCAQRLAEARALVTALDGLDEDESDRELSIYFIRRGDRGPIKIGITQNIAGRLKSLRTGCAEPLTVVAQFPATEVLTERGIHQKFDHLRLEGEWFKHSPEIDAFIADLKAVS
jgi:hypothetical protein